MNQFASDRELEMITYLLKIWFFSFLIGASAFFLFALFSFNEYITLGSIINIIPHLIHSFIQVLLYTFIPYMVLIVVAFYLFNRNNTLFITKCILSVVATILILFTEFILVYYGFIESEMMLLIMALVSTIVMIWVIPLRIEIGMVEE